jgi:hypothetical protein
MGFFVDTLARLAITEVFKAGLAKGNKWLNPDEMIILLQQAEVAADEAQSELGGLFRRIDRDGANGYQKFLKFFQSGLVQNELQRPFQILSGDCSLLWEIKNQLYALVWHQHWFS